MDFIPEMTFRCRSPVQNIFFGSKWKPHFHFMGGCYDQPLTVFFWIPRLETDDDGKVLHLPQMLQVPQANDLALDPIKRNDSLQTLCKLMGLRDSPFYYVS